MDKKSLKVAGQVWRPKWEQDARQPPLPMRRFSLFARHTCPASYKLFLSTYTHWHAVKHRLHIVIKASDEFQPLTLLQTREIGSLLSVLPWCILVDGRPCLHCNNTEKNGGKWLKLWSHDHNRSNYNHACAQRSMAIIKKSYGKILLNFLLTLV